MKVTHLTARDFARQPWRNGGGFTTQLAVHAEGGEWIWRLSVAEVAESGPFSDFSGFDRTLLLVDGAGMELSVEGQAPVRLQQESAPFTFDGGAPTRCRLLGGPVRDLNLMVARGRARGALDVIEGAARSRRRLDARWNLVYAMRGTSHVHVAGRETPLAAGEMLRIDDARAVELAFAGADALSRVALASIDPTEAS